MKMLNIAITEQQYAQYGFSKEQFDFDEFVKMLKKNIAREALRKSRAIALKSPLREMTMEEINAEVAAVRRARKLDSHAQTGT